MRNILFIIIIFNSLFVACLILWMLGQHQYCKNMSQHSDPGFASQRFKEQFRFDDLEIVETKNKRIPLLVIFTTFNAKSFHHVIAHRLVISNWISFGDLIKPVLFANPNGTKSEFERFLIKTATGKGWDVLSLTSTNPYGTPHLKPMYKEIFKRYNASFYGYSNGDLMFTDKLLESLQYLQSILRNKLNNNAMLVGRRTDIELDLNETFGYVPEVNRTMSNIYPEHIQSLEDDFKKSNLPKLAEKGVLRGIFAIDYFFFSRENSTFNWSEIVNVVVGRRAYDQYLIAMAIKMNVNSIDMSRYILAAHLSKPGVPDTGFLHKDKDYNFYAIGETFPYNDGLTSTTTYFLHKNVSSFVLVKR